MNRRIVDVHVHYDIEDETALKQFAESSGGNGIVSCLIGGERIGAHDYVPNERILQVCKEFPDIFIPFAKVDLWDTEPDPGKIHEFAEKGFRGLKFIYPYYEYDHDIYMPVYEAAEECGLPLLFHTGDFRPGNADPVYRRPVLKNMNPLNLDRIARSFPRLHLIMAHLGTTFWRQEGAELLKSHPNLYADLAGSGAWKALSAGELKTLMQPRLPAAAPEADNPYYAKLVFGSDAYIRNPEIQTEARKHYEALLDGCEQTKDTAARIMGDTVARWLKLN